MENSREQFESPEAYNAREKVNEEIEEEYDSRRRREKSSRARRFLARAFKRNKSENIIKKVQKSEQSSKQMKEEMVTASVDAGYMRRLMYKMKVRDRKTEKLKKEMRSVKAADKLDGTPLF